MFSIFVVWDLGPGPSALGPMGPLNTLRLVRDAFLRIGLFENLAIP